MTPNNKKAMNMHIINREICAFLILGCMCCSLIGSDRGSSFDSLDGEYFVSARKLSRNDLPYKKRLNDRVKKKPVVVEQQDLQLLAEAIVSSGESKHIVAHHAHDETTQTDDEWMVAGEIIELVDDELWNDLVRIAAEFGQSYMNVIVVPEAASRSRNDTVCEK